jgi:hypothetical protein
MNERLHDERGSVLVLTLMLTLVILGIGLMAMYMSSSTTKVSSNLVRRQEAMQAARAGMAQARAVLLQLVGTGGSTNPNFSPALRGTFCSSGTPPTPAVRIASYIPGKGWPLCQGVSAASPAGPMQNVAVVGGGATTTAFGGTDYTNVQFTAWIRNDDDEYRWCNRNPVTQPDHGELTPDSGDCNGSGGYDAADDEIRLLTDEDSRVIVRVEAAVATASPSRRSR